MRLWREGGVLILFRQNMLFYKKVKGGDGSTMVREVRALVNVGSSISLITRLQGSKRRLGAFSPQMRAIFKAGTNWSLVLDNKLSKREKAPGPE